ncbi:MAG: phage protein Gp36 family protein [Myxococcota bacterium]
MAYATAQEMEGLIGTRAYREAADRDLDGSADSAAVDAALAKASSVADSYITKWLPLPGDPPEALKDAVIRIAHYQLTGETGNEETRKRYEDAIQWLRDVAAGKASLGIPPTPEETSAGAPELSASARQMSRDSLRGVL